MKEIENGRRNVIRREIIIEASSKWRIWQRRRKYLAKIKKRNEEKKMAAKMKIEGKAGKSITMKESWRKWRQNNERIYSEWKKNRYENEKRIKRKAKRDMKTKGETAAARHKHLRNGCKWQKCEESMRNYYLMVMSATKYGAKDKSNMKVTINVIYISWKRLAENGERAARGRVEIHAWLKEKMKARKQQKADEMKKLGIGKLKKYPSKGLMA